MLNSPIDDLKEALNRVKEENEYLKQQLASYKRIGHIEFHGLNSFVENVGISVKEDLIYVELARKQYVLTPADMVMLANLNGLFNNIPGGAANEERC